MSATVPPALLVDCTYAQLGDGAWQRLLTEYSPQAIEHAVLNALSQTAVQPLSEILGFVRYLVTLAPAAGCHDAARRRMCEEPVLTRLCELIDDSAFYNRYNAINTLGKIGAQTRLPELRQLFEQSVDSDPLLLGGLVFEIRWLESTTPPTDRYARRCLASPSPLTRWAGLDVLDRLAHYPEDSLWLAKQALAQTVQNDPDRRVAQGAQFMLAEMEHVESLESTASRAEKRRQRKALEKTRPPAFRTATHRFTQMLWTSEFPDYTVAQLEAALAKPPAT